MEVLVENLAKALVSHPEEVKVSKEERNGEIIINLSVAQADMGKVIGKQGKIAKALRTLVKAATPKGAKKYVVEIKVKE